MNSTGQLWQPTQSAIHQSEMWKFMQLINREYQLQLSDYDMLHQWSIEHTEKFWLLVSKFSDIVFSKPCSHVLDQSENILTAKWFIDAKLNYAENLLVHCRRNLNVDSEIAKPAIIFQCQDEASSSLSYTELYQQVAATANALKQFGVVAGDRVVGFLPNIPESIITMLATTSLGAIWSSCSPDFGFTGVMDRFSQIMPKVLFSADGYQFKNKKIDSLEIVKQLQLKISSIEKVVIVPYLTQSPEISHLDNIILFTSLLKNYHTSTIEFEQLDFCHPLFIMYSSGTTGKPKCIVHSAGGTLIQHQKELRLHTNLTIDDRFFYYTTCGWMMWNWMVSGLATGATLVLYDGSPFYPNADTLIDFAEKHKISIFGCSAKYISALQKTNVKPIQSNNLMSLKVILSTGSPLTPELFNYVYQDVKQNVHLASISGGTDIISCFALGCPIKPVYRGELQVKGLGMAINVFDENGNEIVEQKGELVCTNQFPSMPLYFWQDDDNRKYHNAYFNRFKNIWAHGDYAEITQHNGLIIHGRSDAVLNPGGVRIGTSEIYQQVEKLPEIMESIAVGQNFNNDTRIILFVKLKEGLKLDPSLKGRIKSVIRDNTSPRHVPEIIIAVKDIPRTISGKIVELAVRNVIHQQTVNNTEALANPAALEYFKNLPELQGS